MLEIVDDFELGDVIKRLGYDRKVNENVMNLRNDPGEFDILCETLRSGLLKKKYTAEDIRDILMCIDEAFSNAVFWGNANRTDKNVAIRFFIARKLFAASIEDQGKGFDARKIINHSSSNISMISNRGVFFMLRYMNKVIYNAKGNKVALVKYNDK